MSSLKFSIGVGGLASSFAAPLSLRSLKRKDLFVEIAAKMEGSRLRGCP